MEKPFYARVISGPLAMEAAYRAVLTPEYGAVNSFIGVVRNNHDQKDVSGITYDVHVPLAEAVLADICKEALNIWEDIRIYVAHAEGALRVGDISIIIAVGSPHRAESFEACRYVIEEVKKRVPVWKQEHYTHDESRWLPGTSLNEVVRG